MLKIHILRDGKPIDDIDYNSTNIYIVFNNEQINIIN